MGQEGIAEEIAKLERQLQDEKFLSKAPATAIEKVRAKLAKLQSQFVPTFPNRVLDEGEWGFRWERMGDKSIWVAYPDRETGFNGRGAFGYEFIHQTSQDADRTWAEVNLYWVHPSTWLWQIWRRDIAEAKEERRKLYLTLKEEFDAESDSPATLALV